MTRRQLLGCAFVGGLAPGAPAKSPSWVKDLYRELHLDAHFSQLPAPYDGFDAEAAAQMLSDAGFQMVSFFASCNAGHSYFPTKLGTPHPGLKSNYTGDFAAALKKRGIRVLPYVSVGPDRRAAKEHPEWTVKRAGSAGMCLNSPWVEEAHIPYLREIVSQYGVDGFFLDSLLGRFVRGPCYCSYCREAFGAEIPTKDDDLNVFEHHRFLTRSLARYATKVIDALPGLALVFTHVWVSRNPVNPPAGVNQLVWEPVPPYSGVHSFDLSLEGRYLATVPGIGNWSGMVTRGNGWGDFSLREPAAFAHESAVALANGGRAYLSDDNYPTGNPDRAVYHVYGEVNRRTRELEPNVKGCSPVKDIAVLLSADSIWSTLPLTPSREWMSGPSSPGVAGAHKALVEAHAQFSIVNSETLVATLDQYRALVLPEQRILSAAECEAIRRFVRAGGALIVTGETGAGIADVLGVRLGGWTDARRSFVRMPVGNPAGVPSMDIPPMDIQVRGGYCRVEGASARALLDLIPPSGPRQVPGGAAVGPAVTSNVFGEGRAIYCAVPLFSAYHLDGTAALRKLAHWILDSAHPRQSRTIALDGAPMHVEVSYNGRGAERFVHLINASVDRRLAGAPQMHEFSAVQGIRVNVRIDAKPRTVQKVPQRTPVATAWKDGWATFNAEPLEMHNVYRIEEAV